MAQDERAGLSSNQDSADDFRVDLSSEVIPLGSNR